jgi:hypothetical protein
MLAAGAMLKPAPSSSLPHRLFGHFLDGMAFGDGMRGDKLAASSQRGSLQEFKRMAWFTNRRPNGQPKRSLFRRLLGRAAEKSSRERIPEKRHAHRVDLSAPVFVYGSINGEPFSEISKTLDVCVKGALVATSVDMVPEQRVLLTNLQTQRDLECRVVRIDAHRGAAALEFLEPCPGFWCIDFASTSTVS